MFDAIKRALCRQKQPSEAGNTPALVEQLEQRCAAPLTAASVRTLLVDIERQLGYRPMQVTGPGLKVRWHWKDRGGDCPGGELLQLECRFLGSAEAERYEVSVAVHDEQALLREEELNFGYGLDGDLEGLRPGDARFDLAYNDHLWNLNVAADGGTLQRIAWVDTTTPTIPTWDHLVTDLGELLAELPRDLALVPWFDGEFTLVDRSAFPDGRAPGCLHLRADANGLRVRMTALTEAGPGGVCLALAPAQVAAAAPLLAQAYASNFPAGYRLDDVQLELAAESQQLEGFGVGLRTVIMDDAVDEYEALFADILAAEPNYTADLAALCSLAQWHTPLRPGAALADLDYEFPAWNNGRKFSAW